MTSYTGKATLLAEDGRKFDADAALTKDQSGNWRGTLAFHNATLVRQLINITDGHILVDGSPGEFIRPNTSDWTANTAGPFTMHILGSGPAPF
ncbi:hypothetical protein [Streptomyces reticuli]|uniref:hypothetical protein n=1 Tax=Streptomyces reticuli TaxID=1926 RepID=UPI00073DC6CA|nr:hypothetical protein [Streptomyces sp. SID7810]CUW31803.1 hypothetical protein TUE45_06552 [Streptomyces reticuli]